MPTASPSPAGPPSGRPETVDEPLPAASPPAIAGRKRLNSLTLFGNEREIEIEIEHSGQLYRLRLTSLGKLILTK
ncbi:hemin uptake protein HemP [Roseateles violae]|uniref:Hemin uptake protein HemP n=1 Tax=Roseateles violae TaxID=3058042 RepID=A0ABT8DRD1_9BURK|nr:hemin uptake protein HemP [Pelomonas sp. PFR6]MDN3920891.1 hemin uptake protein HemP [Pelomonas sp. PFR6]